MAVEIVQNNVIFTFPKYLLESKLIQNLISKIEFEMTVQKSMLTEEQSLLLSEEINTNWWNLNKEKILNRILNAENCH